MPPLNTPRSFVEYTKRRFAFIFINIGIYVIYKIVFRAMQLTDSFLRKYPRYLK